MGIKSFIEKLFGKGGTTKPSVSEGPMAVGKEEGGTKLVCTDCKSTFLFEIGEQRFYKMRGLTPPKRCPSCRSKRKHHRK